MKLTESNGSLDAPYILTNNHGSGGIAVKLDEVRVHIESCHIRKALTFNQLKLAQHA